MEIDVLTFYMIGFALTIGSIGIGWFISKKPRIYLDIGAWLLAYMLFNFLALRLFEVNQYMGIVAYFVGSMTMIVLAIRVKQAYTDPIADMKNQLKAMQQSGDFTKAMNLQFTKGYDHLKQLYEAFADTILGIMSNMEALYGFERQTINVVDTITKVSTQIEQDIQLLTDSIDENLQSAVMGNEVSERIQKMVQGLSEEYSQLNHRLTKEIISTDTLSDQTNLIAVNASIEAAHNKEQGENFAIVADGIQRLSSRSRETATELAKVNASMNKLIAERLNQLAGEFANLDDILFQIADLSDKVSAISHNQKSMNDELNRQLLKLEERHKDLQQKKIGK
ncbi:MAG: hypothetical protein INQ03_01975 [Candidatus Heimdallarchaeota archaeon]|nr:hypothetical protein [Candidatus Heimdallarchaeota archaeon]